MQRSHAAFVHRVGKRTPLDKKCDHVTLRSRIPTRVARSAVGGVVERLGSASVTSADMCASREEQLSNLRSMRSSSHVQSRVTPGDVMVNRNQEVLVSIVKRTGREIRC